MRKSYISASKLRFIFPLAFFCGLVFLTTLKEQRLLLVLNPSRQHGRNYINKSESVIKGNQLINPTWDSFETKNGYIRHQISMRNETKSICQIFSKGQTVASIWRSHFQDLLEAAEDPNDRYGVHCDWIDQLLKAIKPNLLERGLIARLPKEYMKQVIEIIDRRLKNEAESPLLVAVFGGSVAAGSECERIPAEIGDNIPFLPLLKGKNCSWPFRVQLLADYFLGPGVIHVENLAVGGTDSLLTLPILNYRLYSNDSMFLDKGPDVIINSFALNDHLPRGEKMKANATTTSLHFDDCLFKAQQFASAALESKPCQKPPAVIFLDEYVGNRFNNILSGDIRSTAVKFVTDYFGLGYIRPSVIAKPIVYSNEKEGVFSPQWFNYLGDRIEKVHPSMTGHQHIAFTVAYAAVRAASDFCIEENAKIARLEASEARSFNSLCHGVNEPLSHHAVLQSDGNSSTSASQKTDEKNWVTPPNVSPDLAYRLHFNRSHLNASAKKTEDYCHNADAKVPPCPFAFVATPAGTTRQQEALDDYLRRFLSGNSGGWYSLNDFRDGSQNKLGFVAKTRFASAKLLIPRIENRIQILTLHYLKSYGTRWQDSMARFDLRILRNNSTRQEYNTTFSAVGYHEIQASVAFSLKIDLEENAASIGDSVELQMTLVNGTEFKIISLMLCAR